MANGVVNDQGLLDFLTDLIAGSHFTGMRIHLYQNAHSPSNTDTLSSYTECTFAGYSAQTVYGWSAATVASHVAQTIATANTFNLTAGSQTVYGCYFTDNANAKLYGAVLDPNAPITLNTSVNQYTVTTTFTEISQF